MVTDQQAGRTLTGDAIPAGAYTGQMTTNVKVWVDDELLGDDSSDTTYQEVFNADGLPLFQPNDQVPTSGLVVETEEPGYLYTMTILTVDATATQVTIEYDARMVVEGGAYNGTGTIEYAFTEPDLLEVNSDFLATSTPTEIGEVGQLQITSTATLQLAG